MRLHKNLNLLFGKKPITIKSSKDEREKSNRNIKDMVKYSHAKIQMAIKHI